VLVYLHAVLQDKWPVIYQTPCHWQTFDVMYCLHSDHLACIGTSYKVLTTCSIKYVGVAMLTGLNLPSYRSFLIPNTDSGKV
jgi:hypothetical protein